MTAVVGNENQLLSFPQSGTWRGVCCASLCFEELYDFILWSLLVKRPHMEERKCVLISRIFFLCLYKSHQLAILLVLNRLFLTVNEGRLEGMATCFIDSFGN